jgi:hypothetical protein
VCLKPLHANAPGRFRRYDWPTRSASDWVEVWPADYVLLEGVSASREAFRPHLSLTVWVETPRDMRLRRGVARDGPAARGPVAGLDAHDDTYVTRERYSDT